MDTIVRRTDTLRYDDRLYIKTNLIDAYGELSINDFSPFLKNPLIARFFMQLGRVDELGSGLLNVNRYIKDYSGNVNVHFIEGITFRTIIPLTEGVIEGVINIIIDNAFDNISAELKVRLIRLLNVIKTNEGKRVPDLSEITQFTNKSLERYVKRLRDANLIEYKGTTTWSGGYYITKSIKRQLSK